MSNVLERVLSRIIVFEKDITRQRVDEDLRLCGIRPEPADAVDIGRSNQLASLLPYWSASGFGAAIDRPAKVRIERRESQNWNHQTVTAVDWDHRTFPPDAWLNQGAIAPSLVCHRRSTKYGEAAISTFGGLTLAICTSETHFLAR